MIKSSGAASFGDRLVTAGGVAGVVVCAKPFSETAQTKTKSHFVIFPPNKKSRERAHGQKNADHGLYLVSCIYPLARRGARMQRREPLQKAKAPHWAGLKVTIASGALRG